MKAEFESLISEVRSDNIEYRLIANRVIEIADAIKRQWSGSSDSEKVRFREQVITKRLREQIEEVFNKGGWKIELWANCAYVRLQSPEVIE